MMSIQVEMKQDSAIEEEHSQLAAGERREREGWRMRLEKLRWGREKIKGADDESDPSRRHPA
jgi:hypothetical protein